MVLNENENYRLPGEKVVMVLVHHEENSVNDHRLTDSQLQPNWIISGEQECDLILP
jgi:hypothetical protein